MQGKPDSDDEAGEKSSDNNLLPISEEEETSENPKPEDDPQDVKVVEQKAQ